MRPAPLAATTRRAKTRVVPLLVFRRLGGDVFATAREVRREHRLRLLVLGPRLGIARRRFGRGFGRGFVGVAFVLGLASAAGYQTFAIIMRCSGRGCFPVLRRVLRSQDRRARSIHMRVVLPTR